MICCSSLTLVVIMKLGSVYYMCNKTDIWVALTFYIALNINNNILGFHTPHMFLLFA